VKILINLQVGSVRVKALHDILCFLYKGRVVAAFYLETIEVVDPVFR